MPVPGSEIRAFGPCQRDNCQYRMERCTWGYCYHCCSSYHRLTYSHFKPEEAATPPHGGGYRTNLRTPLPLVHNSIASHVTGNAPIIAGNATPAAQPKPERKPLVLASVDWPSDATPYSSQSKAVEEINAHPLFRKLTEQS